MRDEGGIEIGGELYVPDIYIVGRNAHRLERLANELSIENWTTDLSAALNNPDYPIMFDGAITHLRTETLMRAIEAGKHIYSEKPVAPSVTEGCRLLRAAQAKGLKHGAVEDKVYLPGLQKLAKLLDEGFLGEVLQFKLEFGWWVFDGIDIPCQRPSWNYRNRTGGGMISDMHPHWRYIIERLLGPISSVVAVAWTATPRRVDEDGTHYKVDVEDSTAALIELRSGIIGSLNASWATRVWNDEPLAFHIDGTLGSAIAGPQACHSQSYADTPAVTWNLTSKSSTQNSENWREILDPIRDMNSYRVGWEGFLSHVIANTPFSSTFEAGIRDVKLAEACLRSHSERRWVSMDDRVNN
jgi:predicted dehydrogenase